VRGAVCSTAAGADAGAHTAVQRTPLHEAAAAGCMSAVSSLVAAALCTVDAQDAYGLTPAALAARAGHVEVAAMLGAGHTAMQVDSKQASKVRSLV
jgi:ankyrin repeat protein